MLKRLIALLALQAMFVLEPAYAQGPNTPIGDEATAALDALQKQWGGHAPPGWRVIMATTGHLLGTQSNDVVLVIEEENPDNVKTNEGLGEASLNINPRSILLLNKRDGRYELKQRFDGFLPSAGDMETPCLADPFMEGPGIEIKNGQLIIGLHYWLSCGSWYVTNHSFKFRAQTGGLRLIGMDSSSFHRAGGMGSTTSINFLTGGKKHVDNAEGIGPQPDVGDDAEMPQPATKWSKVKRGPYYLESMHRQQCAEYETAPVWCGF
jgi:hypothetical protein